jgi:hypothetical protein
MASDAPTEPVALRCDECGHWEKGQRTKDQIAEWLRVHRKARTGNYFGDRELRSVCPNPCGTPRSGHQMASDRTAENWEQAVHDPKAIRAYDDTDGRYLLASDLEAWLRNLAMVSRADRLSSVMHAPLLDQLADAIEGMGSDGE